MILHRSFVCPWVLVSAVQRESLAFRSHHCQSIEKSCSVLMDIAFELYAREQYPIYPRETQGVCLRLLGNQEIAVHPKAASPSCLLAGGAGLHAAQTLRGELQSRCWQLGDLWGMTPPSFGFVPSFVPQKACFSPYCNLSVTRRVCAMLCFVFARSMRRRYVSFVCASRWYGSVTLCMAVHTCYLSFFIFDLVRLPELCKVIGTPQAAFDHFPWVAFSASKAQLRQCSCCRWLSKAQGQVWAGPLQAGNYADGWLLCCDPSAGRICISKAMEEPERNEHVLV